MPEELRKRLDDATTASGRSLNNEIIHRLEGSFEVQPPVRQTRAKGENTMGRFTGRRALVVLAVITVALAAAIGGLVATNRDSSGSTHARMALKQLQRESQGAETGPGGESNDYLTLQEQFAEARTAPDGIVNPGAYSTALGQLTGLTPVGGSWTDITKVPYDADHPAYRDFFSNSSGGSGLVTGRITGLASDAAGDIWAAGADGGVWRRNAGAGSWTAISDNLLSLSSGALEYFDGKLYYATGEANTGGTSYVGAGVYVLSNPTSSTSWTRIGSTELESSTIGALRFGGGKIWAATLRGVWSHNLTDTSSTWTLSYAPHPEALPASLKPFAQTTALRDAIGTGSSSSTTNAPYKNIANDIAIDPNDPNHVIAAIGWRSGDSYNGFYETTDGGNTWVKINPTGALPASDIGFVTFAYSAHAEKLYAINESPTLLNKLTGNVNSYLDGIYVSNNGSITGPWSKIADSQKLANSGSALKQALGGKGFGPGIQAWYNQLLAVDPANPDHVYAGLEEVYETTNGGSNWNTVGPYWNFYFSCWAPDALYAPDPGAGNRCPQTTHPDQHSVAFGGSGSSAFVVVGNDGGVYKRPLNGHVNGNGNATDWTSLNDGSIDTLQYYAVGIGKINPVPHTITSTGSDNGDVVKETTLPEVGGASGVLVSGGLQDNGGSLLNPAGGHMVSNFGGDGGDVLVDPNDGCNIVQEYVVLSMSLTQTCASPDLTKHPNAFLDLSQSTTFKIAPPDINARFIAPFAANKQDINEWIAGGNTLWVQNKGFAIRKGSEWAKAYTFANRGRVATAVAMNGNTAIAAWCGPCNNNGFARGIAVGTKNTVTGKWTFTEPLSGTAPAGSPSGDALTLAGVPRRFIGGVAVDNGGVLYIAVNGFSRRFTEGEGAGIGHIFQSTNNGVSWTDISANFPDVPASSIQALSDGSLVVGTDLGVVIRQAGNTTWNRLGTNLPLTVDMDVELGPDNNIYVATHGRGIWSIPKP